MHDIWHHGFAKGLSLGYRALEAGKRDMECDLRVDFVLSGSQDAEPHSSATILPTSVLASSTTSWRLLQAVMNIVKCAKYTGSVSMLSSGGRGLPNPANAIVTG